MSVEQRQYQSGSTYFFTVRLKDERSDLLVRQIDLLRLSFQTCRQRMPFVIGPSVVLPNRLHMIWTLPPGDHAYGARWQMIKKTFARHLPGNSVRDCGGVWQRRYWESLVESATDYEMYATLIAQAPVTERLVKKAADWPHGSMARRKRRMLAPAF